MSYCQEGVLKDGQAYMIYDFGGGTFDVSLLRYQDGVFVRLAEPRGIERCGGIDIDRLIYDDMLSYVAEADEDILRQMQENKKHRMRVETQMSELATKAKHHLSDAEKFEDEISIGWDSNRVVAVGDNSYGQCNVENWGTYLYSVFSAEGYHLSKDDAVKICKSALLRLGGYYDWMQNGNKSVLAWLTNRKM